MYGMLLDPYLQENMQISVAKFLEKNSWEANGCSASQEIPL